jgi:nucleoid-associated protein YejK
MNDGIFTIGEVMHVETERLAMACRINVRSYKNYKSGDPGTYLGFVSIKQPETSDYFLEWIGAVEKKREKEDSTSLVKVINNIDIPNGPDGQPLSREEFRKQAYSAILSFGRNPVNINTLSSTLFTDTTKIKAYADTNNLDLSTEFYPNRSIIKNLSKYHVKADNIEMYFPPEYYGDKIRVDTQNPELIIIKSKQFAEKVISQGNAWKI